MAVFTTPKNLNGAELRDELRVAGIEISDLSSAVQLNENKELVLDIADSDVEKAKTIVAQHNGTTVVPELTVEQKLASVGLSIDDLRAALA